MTPTQIYQRNWREKNADRLRQWNREYYRAHLVSLKATARRYYENNRPAVLKRNAEYARKNCEKVRAMRVRYWREKRKLKEKQLWETPEGRAAKILRGSRCSARGRGVPWNLKIKHILKQLSLGTCAATGLPFVMNDPRSPWRPSIDRINCKKGYIPSNVQIVVWAYNVAKHDFSHETIVTLAKAIVARASL